MAENIEVVVARLAALTSGEAMVRAVAENVADELKASGYADLQNIVAEYDEGVLILRGRVRSFYMKQTAQSLAKKVRGVERIDNRLSVVYLSFSIGQPVWICYGTLAGMSGTLAELPASGRASIRLQPDVYLEIDQSCLESESAK